MLAALVVCSALVRIWVNRGFEGPHQLCDEYIYAGIARRFATTGHLDLAGGPSAGGSLLYPALIAPAWLAHKMSTVYGLAKGINAVLISLTAVPVYLWARRVVSPWWALLAAGLVLVQTGLVLSGMLMSESASLPAFMFALFAIGLAVERGTLWTQALVVVALGLAYGVRAQALVLVVILPFALLLALLLDVRAGVPRSAALRKLRGFWPLAAVEALAVLAFLANSGFSPSRAIGFYRRIASTHYDPASVALWTARHAGEAVLAVGVAPACAFLVLVALSLTRGLPRPADRAFVATAAASSFMFLLQTGAYASAFNSQILERYSQYAFPPILIGFVLWLASGLPRPRLETMFATTATLALVAVVLVGGLVRPGNTPEPVAWSLTLHLFRRVPDHVPGGLLSARILLFALAGLVAVLFALAPARFLRAALPAGVAALSLLASHAAYANLVANTRAWPNWTGPNRSWIDQRIGTSPGRAGFLYVPNPSVLSSSTVLVNTEFWNRSIGRVYSLGAQEWCPLRVDTLRIDRRSGALVDARARESVNTRALVTDRGLSIAGTRLAAGGPTAQPLAVYRPAGALRLKSKAVGVYADGWTGSDASFLTYWLPEPKPKWVGVTLSRAGWTGGDKPGKVTLTLKRLGDPSSIRARRSWVAHSGRSRTFRLPAPKPPFEVAIQVSPTFAPSEFGAADTRELGVQVGISYPAGRARRSAG